MSVRIARSQAEALVAECGFTKPSIDVEAIAKRLGLKVVFADLGKNVSGLLISKGDTAIVAVHEKDGLNRQRFTIAHEIGHFYLGHQFEPGEHVHVDHGHLVTARSPKSSTGIDSKEIEANQFAACLLMPSVLVQKQFHALKVTSLYDNHIESLAERFEVSGQSMTIRLSTLGFL